MTDVIAAFDFDGTLTARDSLLPFLRLVAGRRRLAAALTVAAPGLRHGRDNYKTAVLRRTLAGRDADAVRAVGDSHAAMLVDSGLRPAVRARLEWHRAQGHELLLVSASLDVYLDEVGGRLGLDRVYCTTLDVSADGLLTGRLVGGNCRGARKADLLSAHLADRPGAELWAYGDSSGDDAMLAFARRGFRIGRDGRPTPVDPGPPVRLGRLTTR